MAKTGLSREEWHLIWHHWDIQRFADHKCLKRTKHEDNEDIVRLGKMAWNINSKMFNDNTPKAQIRTWKVSFCHASSVFSAYFKAVHALQIYPNIPFHHDGALYTAPQHLTLDFTIPVVTTCEGDKAVIARHLQQIQLSIRGVRHQSDLWWSMYQEHLPQNQLAIAQLFKVKSPKDEKWSPDCSC